MNLVTDLGSDLAIAFIVEQKHRNRIAPREAITLIDRVTTELQNAFAVAAANNRSAFERSADAALVH